MQQPGVLPLTLSLPALPDEGLRLKLATGAHQGKDWKLLLSLNFHRAVLVPCLEIPWDRYSFPLRLCVLFPLLTSTSLSLSTPPLYWLAVCPCSVITCGVSLSPRLKTRAFATAKFALIFNLSGSGETRWSPMCGPNKLCQ